MRKPYFKPDLQAYAERVQELWGKVMVLSAAPALADMEVGEIAIGNATEAAPAAGSHAVYFKPSAAAIVVIASNGTNTATRFIT